VMLALNKPQAEKMLQFKANLKTASCKYKHLHENDPDYRPRSTNCNVASACKPLTLRTKVRRWLNFASPEHVQRAIAHIQQLFLLTSNNPHST